MFSPKLPTPVEIAKTTLSKLKSLSNLLLYSNTQQAKQSAPLTTTAARHHSEQKNVNTITETYIIAWSCTMYRTWSLYFAALRCCYWRVKVIYQDAVGIYNRSAIKLWYQVQIQLKETEKMISQGTIKRICMQKKTLLQIRNPNSFFSKLPSVSPEVFEGETGSFGGWENSR